MSKKRDKVSVVDCSACKHKLYLRTAVLIVALFVGREVVPMVWQSFFS